MKRIFTLRYLMIGTFCFAAIAAKGTSNPNDYYRSNASSGNWNDATSWQSSLDNINNWTAATSAPTTSAQGITIRNGHVIDIISSVTIDKTVVDGTLRLLNFGFTLANGAGKDELTINNGGVLQCIFSIAARKYDDYIHFGTEGNINVKPGGKIMIGDGTGEHDAPGYSGFASEFSNRVKWNDGAIFEWNTTALNFTHSRTYFPDAAPLEKPIFRISKVDLNTNPGSGSSGDLIFNGILEVNIDFIFAGGKAKIFRNGIRGNATLTQNSTVGNSFNITGTNAILDGASLKIQLATPLNLSSSTDIPPEANITISGGNIKNQGIFTINGSLDVTDISFSPSTSVIINGILKTNNVNGLKGTNSTFLSSTFSINDGSTIEYYADFEQIIETSVDYYNITFKGGRKTFSSASSIKVNSLGTIIISGPNVIVDASTNNLGLITPNATKFNMDGGRLILGTTGTQPNMDGGYQITGGTIEFINSGSTEQTIRSLKTYQNIEVNGNNVGNSNGNILLNAGGSFRIKNSGIFTINDNSIMGITQSSATVIVESGGVFKTGNNRGFNGFTPTLYDHSSIHPNITEIILHPGSAVEYIRNGDQPITNANNLAYSKLLLSGTGNKTAPPNELIILGDLKKTSNSVFVHNNGSVLFNGITSQNYHSVNPQMIFNNLTNNNTIGFNVNDGLSIYRAFLLGNNSKINLNAEVALKSDINNTANVAQIPSNAIINYGTMGSFVIERYIPNHNKAWQLLAAPAKGGSIKDSWQEGATSPNENLQPGFGTTITNNNSSDWQAKGFDAFSAGGPSMKYYDPVSNKYIGINSTNDPIANQSGYFLFVRGDRSVTAYDQSATATTLRTRGKLYALGVDAPAPLNVPANKFALAGNPYASAIDFNNITKPGISNSYIIWDPILTTSGFSAYGYGAFRTISDNVSVPSSGNYRDNNIPPIQSGQAFFVQTTGTDGIVSFNENCKVPGSASIFRGANNLTNPDAQLRGNLYVIHNNDRILIDGTLTQFHPEYSIALDEWDARKAINPFENMGIYQHSNLLAIGRRPLPSTNDTLFYHFSGLKKRSYELEFIQSKWENTALESYLEDNYLQTKTLLADSAKIISFTVNDDPGSYANNRFHIIFKETGIVMAATITNINAYQKNNDILIEWDVAGEANILTYILESSLNGIHFENKATLDADNYEIYQWLDVKPIPGYHYYRVKIKGRNGKIDYTRIVRVVIEREKPSFSIYPNHVKNGFINLQPKNQPKGIYHVKLINITGQQILSKNIQYKGSGNFEPIRISARLAHGLYHLQIFPDNGESEILELMY